MTTTLRLAIAQLNLLVGDVAGNVERILAAARRARDEQHADLVVFPELALTGYPPEDLLLRPAFQRAVDQGLERLAREAIGIELLVGHPQRDGARLYNAASLLRDGRTAASYRKHLLPNYGVFDELRYFHAGADACVVTVKGVPVGITICEDAWQPEPAQQARAAGARVLVNLNASPYHMEKGREREQVVATRARETGLPVVYANLVGGQDELVFDGDSFVLNAAGRVARRGALFAEDLFTIEFEADGDGLRPRAAPLPAPVPVEEEVYRAIVLGVQDYVHKNGFPGVVIGLSGGIDSALTLCIAVDALGPKRVEAVMMPSRHTADMSREDAAAQARALGVTCHVIPIEPMFEAFMGGLREEFKGRARDVTEENIQARIRGTLLMAVSNKTGRMVLTTGNKSEMAVGYATLYGDMAGGFAAIKDVPKTLVYRLAEWRDAQGLASADHSRYPASRDTGTSLYGAGGGMPGAAKGRYTVIPRRVFERPPSAELAPDQKDTDSLPPYDVLDAILERYVERDESPEEIIAAGYDSATVARVAAMVDRNEYKRRQAAPGVRISRRAFGRDRRYPITSGFGRPPRAT